MKTKDLLPTFQAGARRFIIAQVASKWRVWSWLAFRLTRWLYPDVAIAGESIPARALVYRNANGKWYHVPDPRPFCHLEIPCRVPHK